jgi:predicted dienelactone hydrolase
MPLLHRGLAIHLARHGFVVAAPEHPGDSRTDNRLAGTEANLRHRPRHVTAVIDWMLREEFLGPSLLPDTAAVVGHSLGGYTALAIAGGRPAAFPWEADNGESSPIDVTPDPRVRALVLLAPAAAWFLANGALEGVSVPILMMTGEKDDLEIAGNKMLPDGRVVFIPWGHSEVIKRRISTPGLIEHRIIPNAGHYSFMSPYPVAMRTPTIPPSQDPIGFDRVSFYEQLCADVLAFLRKNLTTWSPLTSNQ